MSEDLVEKLANVLYDAYCDGPRFRREFGDQPHWRWTLARIDGDREASAEMRREPWRRAARECLRQMEWARRNCITGNTLIEREESGAIYATKIEYQLTIAPDDWQP